ncbi:fungal-specific transcription factor domain-domain-containing protein [Microdochium bolleyi]|uniref:Fungal-specific transcription factor domain-domain-containing protein n=1 Tax=Microdochium bolleyi TaxID=196109 RepID=A0A136IVW6_9PEZI|nr:fungal-specific transcription factor domain-domain-containing protein [Microdochium bolleyi]
MSPAARRRRRRRVPDENRKRAPRACTRCKARKSRCIEITLGACQRCRLKSLPCVFERNLVSSRAAGETQKDSTGDTILCATSPGQSENAAATASETSPTETFVGDGDPSERFMWPRFLSKLRETFSLDPHDRCEPAVAQVSRPPPTISPADLRRLRKAADAFPPRPVADFLLSVCIEHGTDSFYYFDQVQFLAEIDQFYTDPRSRLRYDISFICLAYAAFALGSQWTTLARPDGRKPPPILQEDNDPGRIFYNQARALVPDVIDLPCLRAVQATFVLGVYLLPASSIGSAYIYLGLALRKALAMDLHLSAEEVGVVDEDEKEIRKRIWWAVYSLERSSTIKLNRPRTVNPAIITVGLPEVCPDLDQNQKFNNIEHQIADARLMLILDRVSEPSEWADTRTSPGRLCDELKAWKRSLPPSLKLSNVHPKSSSYRATFHLYLNYYFGMVAMGKVSVVTVVRARLRHAFGLSTSSSSRTTPHRRPSVDPSTATTLPGQDRKSSTPPVVGEHTDQMSRSCIKAAKKMLHLFEDLSRTGNLTRFSFTDFQGCSIATIVILLAGIIEHDDPGFERQATFGLNCLRKMAEGGNGAAKTGVQFVEALQSITSEASEKLKQVSSVAALAAATSSTQGSFDATPGGATDAGPQGLAVQEQTPSMSRDHYNGWVEWLSRQPAYQFSPTSEMIQPMSNAGGGAFAQQGHQVQFGSSNSATQSLSMGMAADPTNASPDSVAMNAAANIAAWQADSSSSPQEIRRFSRWDGAAALQQLSVPAAHDSVASSQAMLGAPTSDRAVGAGIGSRGIIQHQQVSLQQQQQLQYQHALQGQQPQMMSATGVAGGGDMFSTMYADDQAFLMGLTGWDVLGFSELYE